MNATTKGFITLANLKKHGYLPGYLTLEKLVTVVIYNFITLAPGHFCCGKNDGHVTLPSSDKSINANILSFCSKKLIITLAMLTLLSLACYNEQQGCL
jgi:hypothetical protein